MKLVVGLGNPGRRYAKTRHNLGYQVVDVLAERWRADVTQQKFNGLLGRARCDEHEVVLLKPTTFMNRSGESVLAVRQFFKLALEDLLVVMDDLDLPVGRVRVRGNGSAGGHKGLGDIIRRLGSDEITRVRIGIGSTSDRDTVNYVLGRADEQEEALLAGGVSAAADAVTCWIRGGTERAMNEFNGLPTPARRDES
ncbi:MAG: aminoacyl-tRNA hydrolase [Phycisphaerae bacterium]|nr:aminoacyl-tRNA hydrolase [Phycisphaerae bacterium]